MSFKLLFYTDCYIISFLVAKPSPRRPRWLGRRKTGQFLHLNRPCHLLPLRRKHQKTRLSILNQILLSHQLTLPSLILLLPDHPAQPTRHRRQPRMFWSLEVAFLIRGIPLCWLVTRLNKRLWRDKKSILMFRIITIWTPTTYCPAISATCIPALTQKSKWLSNCSWSMMYALPAYLYSVSPKSLDYDKTWMICRLMKEAKALPLDIFVIQ